MSCTTIELKKTQCANFSGMTGKVGTVMIVDTDNSPTGGYYVRETSEEGKVGFHSSKYGPLLLIAGRQEYTAKAHMDHKTIVEFSISKIMSHAHVVRGTT